MAQKSLADRFSRRCHQYDTGDLWVRCCDLGSEGSALAVSEEKDAVGVNIVARLQRADRGESVGDVLIRGREGLWVDRRRKVPYALVVPQRRHPLGREPVSEIAEGLVRANGLILIAGSRTGKQHDHW